MSKDMDGLLCDSEAARLLPWLVTGRLGPSEQLRVERHLEECPVCRADLDEQKTLLTSMAADRAVEYAPQASFEKLMTRVGEMERELPSAAGAPDVGSSTGRVPRWLVAAVVVQAIALGLLGGFVWSRSGPESPGEYQTLSTAPPSTEHAPRLRVVFAPETTVAEVAQLVGPMRGVIVAGPSEAGVYTLAFPEETRPDRLAEHAMRLRASDRVLFAEPLSAPVPNR